MFNEIGSNFFEKEKERSIGKNFIDKNDLVYLDSGRNAIRLVLKNLKLENKIALLPAYTCHTVIEPFITKGYKVFFYDVNKNFNIDERNFEELVEKVMPSVILIHAYFGKDTLRNIRQYLLKLRENGIIIIEDITQLLLKDNKDEKTADFIVGSIRKWCSIPEGGFVKNNTNIKLEINKYNQNAKLVEKKVEASEIKKEYSQTMKNELKNKYLELYKEAENLLDKNEKEIFVMSNYTKNLIERYDFEYIKRKRKENYKYLYDNLKNIGYIENGLGILEQDETPLYFPLFVKKGNREELQKYMAENNIYCPIIWPMPGEYIKDINMYYCSNIYKEIICIPCDQRYDLGDMQRVVDKVKEYYKRSIINNGK